jgi:hypothetical protein
VTGDAADDFDWTYESPRINVEPAGDPWHLDFADIEFEPIHLRNYAVRAFRRSPSQVLIRGVVDDRKDGSIWVPWDHTPMVVHHMIIDLVVDYPSLAIVSAEAAMEVHPHEICHHIAPKYHLLAGVSISRGFTHKVREMFGGPKGCTHVTALLQAMAPVAMQATWAMAAADRQAAAAAAGFDVEHEMLPAPSHDEMIAGAMRSLNTCHVFDGEGAYVKGLQQGIPTPMPVTIKRRYAKHGISWESKGTGR